MTSRISGLLLLWLRLRQLYLSVGLDLSHMPKHVPLSSMHFAWMVALEAPLLPWQQ
jgi:hypothetical protein